MCPHPQVSCHHLTLPLAGVGGAAEEGGERGSPAGAKPGGPGSSGPLGFALKQAVLHMHGAQAAVLCLRAARAEVPPGRFTCQHTECIQARAKTCIRRLDPYVGAHQMV